jgi:hypothetical protein
MKISTERLPAGTLGMAIIMICCCSRAAISQSSLFNAPTTDVMPVGETYLEADFDSHLTSYERGGYQSYGVYALHGVSKRVEIGLNAYFTKTGSDPLAVELQPNAKWQMYSNEGNGIAVAAGVILYIPIKHRPGSDSFGSVYATASKKLAVLRGARFTTGGYTLVGRAAGTGSKSGAVFGYEQPVHRKLSFIADWKTGKNRFGYAAAGLGITLSRRSLLYTAYYFGNEGRGNNSFGIYYGISF